MVAAQVYLYEEIAESIRRQIADGTLNVGDRLPTVRAMARDWSCTTGTVHRAYQILSGEGLIVSRQGQGTRVAPSPLQPPESGGTQRTQLGRVEWAALVNRAEQYLLEAARAGYDTNQAQTAMSVAVARWRALRQLETRNKDVDKGEAALRFSGSHDLAIEHLATILGQGSPPIKVELRFTGSMGGLLALLRGEVDFAGAHLWDEESDKYNEPYVRRLFPGEKMWLLTLAHRWLGMIVPAGAAGDWPSLEALTGKHTRLANRQRGSGTRMWLDAKLRDLDIMGEDVAGYGSELTTHLAVAEQIADGKANVGIGIQAAADALGLDFVPLSRERYDLVFPNERWNHPQVSAIRDAIQTDGFARTLAAMGGYDSSETGRVSSV